MPELEEDGGEGDEGAEELAGELDAGVIGGHGDLGHGEGLVAEEVIPEAGSGGGHFDEAGDDGEGEVEAREAAEGEEDEGDANDEVEDEPEEGIEGGGVVIDGGIDVISLEPGEEDEEGGEEIVEELHLC